MIIIITIIIIIVLFHINFILNTILIKMPSDIMYSLLLILLENHPSTHTHAYLRSIEA
jgi:hypothetical protein